MRTILLYLFLSVKALALIVAMALSGLIFFAFCLAVATIAFTGIFLLLLS